jgi:hypothetical protein
MDILFLDVLSNAYLCVFLCNSSFQLLFHVFVNGLGIVIWGVLVSIVP